MLRTQLHVLKLASLFLLFNGCSSLKNETSPHTPPKQIKVLKLEAIDLSEDGHTLASQKDEISLFSYLVKNNNTLIDAQSTGIFDFTAESNQRDINFTLKINDPDSTNWLLLLVEHDKQLTTLQIDSILRSNLHLNKKIDAQLAALQLQLGDDDLLDLKNMKVSKLQAPKRKVIKLSGVHLFDSYTYNLHCQFEK